MRDSTRSAMLIINSGVEKIMDGGESIEQSLLFLGQAICKHMINILNT